MGAIEQYKGPRAARAWRSEMLAVAGLLVALGVGACPSGYEVRRHLKQEFCVKHGTGPVEEWDAANTLGTGDAGEPCDVAHDYRCCIPPGALDDDPDQMYSCVDADRETCDTIFSDGTWCPPPAEPADLDGATVGTIVVASLIGVALVGGAIAVHLEV